MSAAEEARELPGDKGARVSIHHERATLPDGNIRAPLRYRARPTFTANEEAIAYVGEVLAEIGPWPEVVEVVEAATLEGRLEEIRGERRAEAAKAHAIGVAVRNTLSALEMAVRMPQLALVIGEHAELLWDQRTYLVAEQGGTLSPLDEEVLRLLHEAGETGIVTGDLWRAFLEAPAGGLVTIPSKHAFLACLRRLESGSLAERNSFGKWRAIPQEVTNDTSAKE